MSDQLNARSAAGDNEAAEDLLLDEEEVPVCQHDDYDATLSLADREAKWGFSLAELQSAVKVVRVLFHDPSLYVGDPYLSDSRLYTMITRCREMKRGNRDIFKVIMNEEKSRKRRYQRMRDIEAVRRTAMKREREDALNSLLLTGGSDSGAHLPPLLLHDRPQTLVSTADASEASSATAAAVAEVSSPGSVALTAAEKEVLRLVGAFENLLRLEAALEGTAVEGYVAADTTAGAPQQPSVDNPPTTGGVGSPTSSVTAPSATKKMQSEAAKGDNSSSADAPRPTTTSGITAIVDWTVVTQLTAQVYRYLPHSFGSQMPPPLFPGAAPPDAVTSPLVVRSFVAGMKCHVAQRAAALVHLAGAASSANGDGESGAVRESTEPVPLCTFLHSTSRDVIVRTPLPHLRTIAGLRALVGGEEGRSATAAVVAAPLDDVLRAMELVLLEGVSDDRFLPVGRDAATTTTPEAVHAAQVHVAEQSLHCFIARRLYGSPRIRDCGTSPVVVDRGPPKWNSEEPDSYCVFDDVQRYAVEHHEDDAQLKMNKWIGCHTCKVRYNRLHPYYYSMCHLCGEYNYNKRLMARDLRGKTVLLTGCRIKIGYAMALSLLRCGATVLGTTRFVHEAVARFQQEIDYEVWKDRLHLFSLDLRDMWVVTQFCAFVRQKYRKLFAIINNAAQTIARTPQYTEHLRHIELHPPAALRASIRDDALSSEWHTFFCHHTTVTVGQAMSIEYHPSTQPFLDDEQPAEEMDEEATPTQSGIPVASAGSASGDASTVALRVACDRTLVFDRYDTQAEESDHRDKNSWVMNLAEVQGSEAAEVMAINALSPFILNGKLKVCLTDREGDATPNEPRFIINVSAMEGQFYRFKQTTHPHTNMAKAALNMMTRTSGDDYAVDGIYMNSVDTGWITDESPKLKKDRRAEQFMLCPLDEVDAAARCLDLIYTDSRVYGKFYKDFREIAW